MENNTHNLDNIIEDALCFWIKIYQFINQKNESKKHHIKITKKIKESLKDPKAKVANRLSLSRVPLGLTIPLTAYITKNQWAVLSMVGFYAISDFLDGFYSKHIINHPTEGGSYLDAICDKIGAIELILGALPKNPSLLLNGTLETIISKTNNENTKQGINVQSTKLGKTKMWPLSAALICTYMSHAGFKFKNFEITKEEFQTAANILIPITAALEVINIIEYSQIGQKEESPIENPEYIEIPEPQEEKAKTKTLKPKSL